MYFLSIVTMNYSTNLSNNNLMHKLIFANITFLLLNTSFSGMNKKGRSIEQPDKFFFR